MIGCGNYTTQKKTNVVNVGNPVMGIIVQPSAFKPHYYKLYARERINTNEKQAKHPL
jgi:hypothetical protein